MMTKSAKTELEKSYLMQLKSTNMELQVNRPKYSWKFDGNHITWLKFFFQTQKSHRLNFQATTRLQI
jgi:hypothetical protein